MTHEDISRADRLRVAAASAVGLTVATYFALEATGALPNVFGRPTEVLATVFAEQGSAHMDILSAHLRAAAYGSILIVSLMTAWAGPSAPPGLRLLHGFCAYVLPAVMVLGTLVQPFIYGALCVPCLLTAFPALRLLELKNVALADLASFDRSRRFAGWAATWSAPFRERE